MSGKKSGHPELIFVGTGIGILLLHIYRSCPALAEGFLPATSKAGKILTRFVSADPFAHTFMIKAVALGLFVVYFITLDIKGSKSPAWRTILIFLGGGLLLYFGSTWLTEADNFGETAGGEGLYAILCAGGYFLAGSQLSKVALILKNKISSETGDIFNKEGTSFPQQENRLNEPFAIHFRACYQWMGQLRKSWISVINPFRGILVIGLPGSGKSRFVIETVIRQLIAMDMPMFVYDYKYDSLTKLVYNHFLLNDGPNARKMGFFSINFDDVSRSHRCNPIHPSIIRTVSDAKQASTTILFAINKKWVHEKDFWANSAISLLASVIWFLRKYEDGRYCTLPHAIEMTLIPYDQLFRILMSEPDIYATINPFKQAFENKNVELLDSQMASLKISLGEIAFPESYYILSGDDFRLEINNCDDMKIFCLSGSAWQRESLAPILSLYADQVLRMMNQDGRCPSAIICDEFSTLRAPYITEVIATGRSRGIIPVLAFQEYSQMLQLYSKQEADSIFDLLGNFFCGQLFGEAAKRISQRFLHTMQKQVSHSQNGSDSSVNESEHPRPAITAATISNLSSGEFVGMVADSPNRLIELKAFHARIVLNEKQLELEKANLVDLPVIQQLRQNEIQKVYETIRKDITTLARKEISRMEGDPEMGG